jgi:hypothetical protein
MPEIVVAVAGVYIPWSGVENLLESFALQAQLVHRSSAYPDGDCHYLLW